MEGEKKEQERCCISPFLLLSKKPSMHMSMGPCVIIYVHGFSQGRKRQ